MKKTFLMLLCATMITAFCAQTSAQQSHKELRKELRERVNRECVKTAKQMTKEGWRVMPGKLPLERQIQEARYAELDTNEDGGGRMNFIGTHQAIGGNYSAAKQICDTRARAEIAQQVGSTIAQQVKDQMFSRNLGDGDLELLDETLSASTTQIAAKLPSVTPIVEMYRELGGGKYEVHMVVSAPCKQTLKVVKQALVNDLKKKTETLAAEVDKMLE